MSESDIKYEMQRWFDIPHEHAQLTFDSYLSMAARKRDVERFSVRFFGPLVQHADKQTAILIQEVETNATLTAQLEAFSNMADAAMNAAMNPPVVMKEFTSADQALLNRAIELLAACSEGLFISGADESLELRVDEFLKDITNA